MLATTDSNGEIDVIIFGVNKSSKWVRVTATCEGKAGDAYVKVK